MFHVCVCVCVHSEHLHKKLCLWRPGHGGGEREGQRVRVGLALWLIAEIISHVVEKSLKKKF